MSKAQIVAALKTAAKPGTLLDIITDLAVNATGRTKTDSENECVAIWKKMGGSDPS